MAREFTDDDRSKPIVTADGARIGTVGAVYGDRVTVSRSDDDEDVTDKIKKMLGWKDDDMDEIYNDHVDSVSEKEVRLRRP